MICRDCEQDFLEGSMLEAWCWMANAFTNLVRAVCQALHIPGISDEECQVQREERT